MDKDGITGFTSRSLLTAPVRVRGRVVAVVQLVNKNPKPSTDVPKMNRSGFYKTSGAGVPNPAGTDAADSAPDVPDDDASHWDEGGSRRR